RVRAVCHQERMSLLEAHAGLDGPWGKGGPRQDEGKNRRGHTVLLRSEYRPPHRLGSGGIAAAAGAGPPLFLARMSISLPADLPSIRSTPSCITNRIW